MRIKYIYHSGFFIEMKECNIVIDYYKGNIPEFDKEKKLYVLSSHGHRDHFNKEVFSIFEECKNVTYILSDDIEKDVVKLYIEKNKINMDDKKIIYVSPNEGYKIDDIEIETLKSTDQGVGFIIKVDEKNIYHSGDLHWWTWHGYETEEEYKHMTENFKREIDIIKGRYFDIVMSVLDPRQERYDWGLEYLLDKIKTKCVIPMHLWGKYDYVNKFVEGHREKLKGIEVVNPIDICDTWFEWR